MLKSEKVELGVGHARLKEEFELLDKAHKALKGAHAILKESHDQLQVKLTKEITSCPPFVLIDNARATNPCCEHAHLVEENTKLKEQLEKGLVSCIQGEKNLNELLSNQKEVVAKEGLGFAPKSKKKKKSSKKSKTKQALPLKDVFVKEGENAPKEKKNKVVGGNANRGKTTHPNKAGDFNLLMFYAVLVMGMFMPNLLVLLMSTLNGLFGFLRPLLLTSKDPFKNGYLKPSIDLM